MPRFADKLAILHEAVFGLEDGIVSTLGALIGIALGTNDQFAVIVAGVAIIAVESISMGIGSYLASRTVQETQARALADEKESLAKNPAAEKRELEGMLRRDGWPSRFARRMAAVAAQNPRAMLGEMAYRELRIPLANDASSFGSAVAMFTAYVAGGAIPLAAYVTLPVQTAVPVSIVAAVAGLFLVGVTSTAFTNQPWWKSGLRMVALAGIAAAIGYLIGLISGALRP